MLHLFKRQGTVYSIVSVIFGLILTLYPDHTLKLMVSVIGWGCLISGVTALIGFITGWRNHQTLITAVTGLAAGLSLMIWPKFFVSIIPFLVGAVIAVHACMAGGSAFRQANRSDSRWVKDFLMALVGLFLGIFIMINPFGSASIVVVIAGIGLIYSGVMGLLITSAW